jgi:thiamine biosynthesis lipoprotein
MRPGLGTFVEVQLWGRCPDDVFSDTAAKMFAAIEKTDELMSFHRETSDLSRINRASIGKWIQVHPWTAHVLRKSLSFHKISSGLFNIAIADVLVEKGLLPGRRSKLSLPPSEPVFEIGKNRVRRLQSRRIDLGGIAKGFAVDRAVGAVPKKLNCSGIVNAGGDLRAFGSKASNIRIRVGRDEISNQILHLKERAVATSDAGPDKVTAAGTILKKKRTVSVIAPDCMTADALTKIALMGDLALLNRCLKKYGAELI